MTGHRRRLSLALVAALGAVALGEVHAQEGPTACPIDGAALARPAARPWNAGAGVDSDGCTWALDADGRRRVAELDPVVVCPSCGVAVRARHLESPLSPVAAGRARQALAALPPETRGRPLERAAAAYGALGPDHPDAIDPEADRGQLLLAAAWASRAEAALAGDDGGYRPATVAAARAHLAALESRARGGDAAPEVRALEASERAIDAARREVEGRVALTPSERLAAAGLRRTLAAVERSLLELRAAVRPPEALPDVGLELVLARAWVRYGRPASREHWLSAARGRFGEQVSAEVERVRRACAEEARLLGLARGAFLTAAGRTPRARPGERARLAFLAADAARRCGDPAARDELRALSTPPEPAAGAEPGPEERLAGAIAARARELLEGPP